jgi:hypothetical protein
MLTKQDFQKCADDLGVSVAALQAVAEVESGGAGFTVIDGKSQPVILWEPHIFWRELNKQGIQPVRSDICYPTWGEKPYPKGQAAQHERLQRGVAIHREAALRSASYGKFQICGFNYRLCGYNSLQDFINDMYKDEQGHLKAFCGFIVSTGLLKHLKAKDWENFSRGYNGPGYAKNNYHKKMKAAYLKYAAA